jgi:hypothetical protein
LPALNGHIFVAIFLPIGSDEEDLLINYDLAIVNFVPRRLAEKTDPRYNVPGVLEGLGKWDYGLETDGEAAGPLRTEDVSFRGAVPL